MKLVITNHWRHCGRRNGHAILLGFEYGHGDYGRMPFQFEICLLGFGLGLKFPPAKEKEFRETHS